MPGQYLFGGNLPDPVKEFCDNNDILWKDFMDMEEISLENAIATAEGAISLAISQCPINLHPLPLPDPWLGQLRPGAG